MRSTARRPGQGPVPGPQLRGRSQKICSEAEPSGHEKELSGGHRRRIGKFEQCNGGTLFLDEIGESPLALQAKILRVLQEQTFERVGGNETILSRMYDPIAATTVNLKGWSAEGKSRGGTASTGWASSATSIRHPWRTRRRTPLAGSIGCRRYSH